MQHLLNKYSNDFPNATPQQAKSFLEDNLIPELLGWIERAKTSGLNLNEYFKQIVKPHYGI